MKIQGKGVYAERPKRSPSIGVRVIFIALAVGSGLVLSSDGLRGLLSGRQTLEYQNDYGQTVYEQNYTGFLAIQYSLVKLGLGAAWIVTGVLVFKRSDENDGRAAMPIWQKRLLIVSVLGVFTFAIILFLPYWSHYLNGGANAGSSQQLGPDGIAHE